VQSAAADIAIISITVALCLMSKDLIISSNSIHHLLLHCYIILSSIPTGSHFFVASLAQTETECNPQFKLKVTKIILFAFSVHINNVSKNTTETEFNI